MEENGSRFDQESLGTYLRKLRLEQSLDIEDITEETKIAQDAVRAMEADDFAALPARAFARGFYRLYAAMLGLDTEEILRRFEEEHKKAALGMVKGGVSVPSWQSEKIGTIAERSSSLIGAFIGLSLLAVIVIGTGVSLYAGYNPAKQLSNWLRSFQQTPVEIIKTTEPARVAPTRQPAQEAPHVPDAKAPQSDAAPMAQQSKYQLVAEFENAADISVTIDDQTTTRFSLSGGTIRTWNAEKSMVLELPEDTSAKLFLNGIMVPLPPAKQGKMVVAIPEYLLD